MPLPLLRFRSWLSWKSSRFINSVCLKFVRSRMVFYGSVARLPIQDIFGEFQISILLGSFGWFSVSGRFDRFGSASVDIARASGGCEATS